MRWAVVCIVGFAASSWAQAAEQSAGDPVTPSPITDRFALSGGFFHAAVSTEGRVDDTSADATTTIPGTPFSAEKDFNLPDRSDQLRVEIMVRMSDRNKLRVDMFDMQRKGTATVTQEYFYGGTTVEPGDVIVSHFDWRQFGFTYTHSFVRNDRFELGAGLGLYAIQAEASAQRASPPAHEDFSGAGPFPTLAVDAAWRVWRQLALSARANYLKLTVDNITGKLADYSADLQYRWNANLAVGVGYELQDVTLNLPEESPSGFMHLKLNGPKAFVRVSF
ncbi:MAG: hypothetical protein QM718_08140 [Steroidobacteraceae bacterium]